MNGPHFLTVIVLLHFSPASVAGWFSQSNRELEAKLFKTYNRKHRPVMKEDTCVQIRVFMAISHIENVNEQEQTLALHGQLWASWKDEYLTWKSAEFNNTKQIAVEPWKIWQPALALYNSAESNNWHLYFHGLPASVSNDGKIWIQGAFTFHVTCLFDFTRYPYDEQECPIVIADWVYDLSRVNLSDPYGDTPFNKPSVRLSYDPYNTMAKKYVSGWEVQDTWRKHCYWGPGGCKSEVPDGQPEWFWSLIEFGIKLRRHEPYFGLTVVLPTSTITVLFEILTGILTLSVFWIDSDSLAHAMIVFSILLQGLFGWELIRKLPPGSGSVPKIVSLYGFNLSLALIAFIVHIALQYIEFAVPEDVELPFQITNVTEWLRSRGPFKLQGLYFDPQKLMNGETADGEGGGGGDTKESTLTSEDHELTTVATILSETQRGEPPAVIETTTPPAVTNSSHRLGHFAQQLYIFRRVLFFVYLFMYLITLPICLL